MPASQKKIVVLTFQQRMVVHRLLEDYGVVADGHYVYSPDWDDEKIAAEVNRLVSGSREPGVVSKQHVQTHRQKEFGPIKQRGPGARTKDDKRVQLLEQCVRMLAVAVRYQRGAIVRLCENLGEPEPKQSQDVLLEMQRVEKLLEHSDGASEA